MGKLRGVFRTQCLELSKMEFFMKVINGYKPLKKSLVVGVRLGSKYASGT